VSHNHTHINDDLKGKKLLLSIF